MDIYNGGTLNVLTDDCTIENADCGIDIYSGSILNNGNNTLTIKNCRQAGLWGDNTTTPIRNILCDNTSTSSYQNGAISVSGSTSAPRISRVTVKNSWLGLKIGTSTTNPMACVDSSHIQPNTQEGIAVLSNCRVDLNGYNNIYHSSGYKALNNPSTGSIDAQYNYWGSSANPPTWSDIISFPDVVTKTNYVTTPYDSTSVAGVYKRALIAENQKSLYEQAENLETSGYWRGALDIYGNLLTQEKNPGDRQFIILSILRICDNSSHDYSGLRGVVTDELKIASTWQKASLDFILCDLLLREGRPNEARDAYLKKMEDYKGTAMEVEMLTRVAQINGDYLHDKAQAKVYAERAALLNPGQESLRLAYASADMNYNPWQYTDKFKKGTFGLQPEPETAKNIVKEYVTISPNPANPLTTITYSLASPTKVRLDIFAVNGQKVVTLVEGTVSAGVHAVKFDGSRYGSGLYFYRFASDRFTKTGKMMLLK
ncbi:MAG: T9SS type A sorting domain-containing protein [Candidatus Latescibacter sp.]|nr:T9SS type A sorting domain-containing protein [Candidatus Latescibacter sp.]